MSEVFTRIIYNKSNSKSEQIILDHRGLELFEKYNWYLSKDGIVIRNNNWVFHRKLIGAKPLDRVFFKDKNIYNLVCDNILCIHKGHKEPKILSPEQIEAKKQLSSERRRIYLDTRTDNQLIENKLKALIGKKSQRKECSLVLKDIQSQWVKQNGLCYYTGLPMNYRLHLPDSLSIDRIDSNQGYHSYNIVLCLKEVNIMKMNLPLEDFLRFCYLIANHHSLMSKNFAK